MKALIVYESSSGNTRTIADAIGQGLMEQDIDLEVSPVHDVPPLRKLRVALLVVGAPTHTFGLSRKGTRKDAHRRGGDLIVSGVREWLETGPASLSVATFDTHERRSKLPGHASQQAAKKLVKLGCTLVTEPESFDIESPEGPLSPGELDRARQWGHKLARLLTGT